MYPFEEPQEKKRPTVAQVYYALRTKFGGKVAEEILDNLEGNPEGYEEVVKLIMDNRLEDLIKETYNE